MKHYIQLLITALLCASNTILGQEHTEIDMVVRDLLEDMAIDGRLSETGDEAQDLYELAEKKIDINSATADELRSIHILTESQVQSIIYERSRLGAFNSVLDLLMLPEFDEWFVERLAKFVKYDDPVEKKKTGHLKGEFLTRICMQEPKARGFDTIVKSPYLGKPYKLLSRNKLTWSDLISVGFVAESDAGEPICSHGVTLTDFTSGFISYKNNTNGVARAVIGHYHAHVGQGLGLWTGFMADQTSVQASLDRRAENISPTLSAAESGFLRGGACMLVHNQSYLTLLASWTDEDASMIWLDNDTTESEAEYMLSVQNDGYHRTKKEIEQRNNIRVNVFGVYASQGFRVGKIGIGVNRWKSSVALNPGEQLYRLHYPNGKVIETCHADYRLIFSRVKVYGEAVLQKTDRCAWAMMSGIDMALVGGSYLTIAYRDFSRRYYSVVQNPFSRWSQPAGERGLYLGLQASPVRQLSVLTTINLYRNRWLTYRCKFPSDGYKIKVNAQYAISKNSQVALRIRIDNNDVSLSSNQYQKEREHRISYKGQYEASPIASLRFKGAIEQVHYRREVGQASIGWWFSQELRWKKEALHNLTLTASISHFDTDDYNSRVYAFLPDMIYSMSTPAMSGRGVIALGQISIDPIRSLSVSARVKRMRRLDEESIGTGNEMTSGNSRTEWKLQLRLKLWK